jgi:hypothetical protein
VVYQWLCADGFNIKEGLRVSAWFAFSPEFLGEMVMLKF